MNHSAHNHLLQILQGEGLPYPQGCSEVTIRALYHIARRIRPPQDDKESAQLQKYEKHTGSQIEKLCERFSVEPPAQNTHDDLRLFLHRCLAGQTTGAWQGRIKFWQEVLAHFDISTLGASEPISVYGYDLNNPEVTRYPPRSRKPITVSRYYRDHECGWWMVFSAVHGGRRDEQVLFGIPLAWSATTQEFGPPYNCTPRFNRNWMEPGNRYDTKNGYLCHVDDYARWFRDNPIKMDEKHIWPWDRYFQYILRMVQTLTGQALLQIHHAAGEDRAELQWKIVPDATNLNRSHIEALDAALTGDATLLRSCVEPAPIQALYSVEQLARARRQHLAHMDTYDTEGGKRKGFALESSQRRAVLHMQEVPEGRLLAVNGPPGTGKTSFLRSVISTLWVQAALDGSESPVILATAYTNKAVTNIIESFAAIPGPAMRPEWTSRWLPDLPSYGWFHPAKTLEPVKWVKYMALRTPDGNPDGALVGKGLAEAFFAEALTGTDAMKRGYLELHAACTGLATPCAIIGAAVADIQGRLRQSVEDMRGWQDRLDALCTQRNAVQDLRAQEGKYRKKVADLTQQMQQANQALQATRAVLKQRQAEREGLMQTWGAYRDQIVATEQARRAQQMAEAVRAHRAEIEALDASIPDGFWARVFGAKARQQAVKQRRARQRALDTELQAIAAVPMPEPTPPSALEPLIAEQKEIEAKATRLYENLRTLQEHRAKVILWLQPLDAFRSTLNAMVEAFRAVPWAQAVAERLPLLDEEEVNDLIPELWDTLEEALDRRFRFRHFHLAARYWEGRWLDETLREETATAGDHLAHLRHMAMLAPVIVATTHSLPRVRHWQGSYGFADLLVFDEAGQAPPELGCAMFAFAKRAIVVGDIYQLEPIWSLVDTDEKFLLERLGINELGVEGEGSIHPAYSVSAGSVMHVAQEATAFGPPDPLAGRPAGIPLQAHYRCRETIIDYCRELIYHEDLRPMRKDLPNCCPYPPMSWVAVANDKAERSKGSWKNQTEAKEIVGWLADEKDRLIAAYGTPELAQLVAIITPFRAQAEMIRELVQRHPQLGPEVAKDMIINTVHALQGAEIPVVAFSVTQTQPPFFANGSPEIKPNLLNVAVSRAQDAFVLFAAPEVLQGKESAPTEEPLTLLVDYLRRRGQRLYPRELVVIESPQKAEHITQALGRSAQILATSGHFMEVTDWALGQAPRWTRISDGFFESLDQALRSEGQFDHLVLATDDDRDGEEIAWHVLRAIRERAPRLVNRSLRMRFHALEPETLREARKAARPGLNLRVVQASLLKRLADYRFSQKAQDTLGQWIGRNQMATLGYLANADHLPEHRYRVVVRGRCGQREFRAYPVFSRASTAATPWMTQDAAWALSARIARQQRLPLLEMQSVERDYPAFPPQTTVRFLLSGWRRYGWRPQESAQHLQNLYFGRFHTVVRQMGAANEEEEGDNPWAD